ncbi:type II toxin-antitoxin system VapC family toxin [Synechococcus sp. CCY 0621]|uniref:type II toxin-antitoxin system VapC family toxin n=1 Tax=Synechococcus sp. CCY 0621 TaxID=2815603 RepID=UPI001C237EC1|nr:type II toxin-antitoxin system VapC family toxin [Synechococcus sp. CCY 0621]
MIVVDTNVVATLLLGGPQTEKAEALLLHDPEWAAPSLWRSELRNVLSGYLRRGQLDRQQVLRLQGQAKALLQGREVPVDSADVFRLAEASNCSAYDCEFVAAALALQTRLISSDRQLLRAFPTLASPLEHAVA